MGQEQDSQARTGLTEFAQVQGISKSVEASASLYEPASPVQKHTVCTW